MAFQLARWYSFTKWPTLTSPATFFLVSVRHPSHNLCPFHANRLCPDYCHSFITAGCATNRPLGMLTTTLTLRPVRRGPKAHGWLASCGLHTISNRFTLLSHGPQAGDIKRRNAGVVCLIRRRCEGVIFHPVIYWQQDQLLETHLGFLTTDGKTACSPTGGGQLAALHHKDGQ